jgi:serine phosphatase RsbU (regulator of sigma subunit)
VVTGVLVIGYVRSRQRVGLQGTLGESMLVDLRDRLEHQGRFPVDLPEGWHVDTVLRSANGDSFSGDFVVGTYDRTGRHLEIVLIDVSGKGLAAGTRSLMLSGAFGGLVGALEPSDFLPTANRYLIRQQWPEGFVTGVHVSLDLGTGDALLAGAGHPPAVHYRAGKGRWVLLDGEQGPVLGVLDEAKFPAQRLRLERGDALMLYTDGLVESPRLDVGSGIDRLVGQAERVMTQGFRGGAAKIMDGVRSGEGDDRALVLLWRD